MHPLVSWAIFLGVAAAVYFGTRRQKRARQARKATEGIQEKTKAVFLNVGSGTDGADVKKKQRKKNKSKKPAVSSSVAKEVVSTDDGGNLSDDGMAQEVDSKDVAKRLQAMKKGGAVSQAAPRQSSNLAPSASPYAASQASSTGADGDIDEEEGAPFPGSSADPSDMLEASTGGPGVLKIGAPIQPPRTQKAKKASNTSEGGIHASKNAKKKEKKKAEREAERADQQARFEQHRKAIRAQETAQQKNKPAPPPASSAWSEAGAKKGPRPPAIATPVVSGSSELLDTFVPQNQKDSDNDTLQQSTTLGDSWESIPRGVMVPEPEWNEVKSKKTRKEKKDDSDAAKSADEYKAKPIAPTPEPIIKPARSPKPVAQKESSKNDNAFGMLDTESTASVGDTRTASSSDWAEVDNLDKWDVHPESSDF